MCTEGPYNQRENCIRIVREKTAAGFKIPKKWMLIIYMKLRAHDSFEKEWERDLWSIKGEEFLWLNNEK